MAIAAGKSFVKRQQGFTLLEMAAVLSIVGLIIGSIFVGQAMIGSSEAQSVISQIASYNGAVHTFESRYNALPGDMQAATAAKFGFTSRAGTQGQGDGNGVIEPTSGLYIQSIYSLINLGVAGDATIYEPILFWIDLSTANGLYVNLIDSKFSGCEDTYPLGSINSCIPSAKIGHNSYIYEWGYSGINYYGLSGVQYTIGYIASANNLYATLTVQQASQIDSKIDDGFPQTGTVTAQLIGFAYAGNAISLSWPRGDSGPTDRTTATHQTSTSCYDDGGTTGARRVYSTTYKQGVNVNCALAFQFQ